MEKKANERVIVKIEAEVKDSCNILISTIDKNGKKITENHEFEHDCVLTKVDKFALALLTALGFDPKFVYQSGVLESWVEEDEDNDFMEFYPEEKAAEKSEDLIAKARAAFQKEKEEMDRKREGK